MKTVYVTEKREIAFKSLLFVKFLDFFKKHQDAHSLGIVALGGLKPRRTKR